MRAFLIIAYAAVAAAACGDRPADPPPVVVGATRLPLDSVLIWRDSFAIADARPTFDEKAVYTLGIHRVYAVDKFTGSPLWSTPLTYPPDVNTEHQGYGMATAGGLVIVGDIDVFGLDPASGAVAWRFAPRLTYPLEREYQRLTTDGETVFIGGVWGNVYAIDARTGAQRWISHVTALPDSFVGVLDPVVADGSVFVSFADDHGAPGMVAGTDVGVASLDASSGRLIWSRYFPRHPGIFPSLAEGVAITSVGIVAAGSDGSLYELDRRTGEVVDSTPRTAFGFTPTETDGAEFLLGGNDTLVVVGVTNGTLVALDAHNLQRKLWTSPLHYGAVWDLTIDSARVYTAFAGGQFAVSNLATGTPIWWIERFDFRPNDAEDILFSPALDNNRIYVGADRDVYAFKRK